MSLLSPNEKKTGALVLEDGTCFPGYLFGAMPAELKTGVLGEIVFNTAMSGYQEILTDPSYLGQIVVMTYPHIGNYGINDEDVESRSAYASGFIAHEFCEQPSNWRSDKSLDEYLKQKNIPGLTGVDTRALTRHIRDRGAMNAYIVSPAPQTKAELDQIGQRLRSAPKIGDEDLVAKVSCKEKYEWTQVPSFRHVAWNSSIYSAKSDPLVVVLDLGVKHNMLRSLVLRNCRVLVVPVSTSADAILAMKPQGVLLSNGPGDPARVENAPDTVRKLLGKVPIFGICMGHQILAHALGAKTYKMKFGHHGANQPIFDIATDRVMITSQNHGYAIDPNSLPKFAHVCQVNLNDQSVEGIDLPEKQAFSVQYHPEACPGPRDSMVHFDKFVRMIDHG